jgi:hypothetical protein
MDTHIVEDDAASEKPVTETAPPDMADDLTVIYGIDARTAEALERWDIRTFNDLLNVDRLHTVLDQDRFLEGHLRPWLERLGDWETLIHLWLRQAEIAAARDWGALQELQDGLNAEG